MPRLLLGTDVVLDAVSVSRPEADAACDVIRRCNYGGDMGLVSPISLNDAFYVLKRQRGLEGALQAIRWLMGLLVIAPVSAEHCDLAINSNEPIFEDGLTRAIAELEDVDFIITRNKSAFLKSKVRSVTAAEYLEMVS